MAETKSKRGNIDRSQLYAEFSAERKEILQHKYFLSQDAGEDIGFERALVDWVTNHRDDWAATRNPD